MKIFKMTAFLLAMLFVGPVTYGQGATPTDYLKVPGPILFAQKKYQLSWTSHPSAAYYKQEYIQQGDNADRFNSMVLLEVLSGSANLKEVVATKIAELNGLKKNNPMVNYESMENKATGEYMLDFLLSQNGATGNADIVEHNIYRYKLFTNAAGKKSILLFGISTRSYGKSINAFLTNLKKTRPKLLQTVSSFSIPAVTVN